MASNISKIIKFTYQQKEHTFCISEAASIERCFQQIMAAFHIPQDAHMNIATIDNNMFIIPGVAADFWVNSSMDIPHYRITTRKLESKKSVHYFPNEFPVI